jgi:hypothetical protein
MRLAMTPKPDDPIDRDAWLQQALRHAPDADAGPPPAVREAILARARQPDTAPVRAARGGGAWWAWLLRPQVAAGFATVALSTVLGTLWWGGSLDEGADPRPAAVREAAAPAPVPASAVQAPAAQHASTPAPTAVQTAAPDAGGTSQDAVQSRRRDAAPAQAPARASKARPSSPTAVDPPPAEPLARTAPAAPPTAPAVQGAPAAPAVVPEAPAELARKSELEAAREVTTIDRLESRSRAPSTSGAATATADTARSFAPGAPPALALRGADPLEWLARELTERGDALRWTWSGRPHPHGAPTQAWFEALRVETAGRWQRVDAAPDAPGASMQLFEGPRVRAEWRIATDRVLWMDPALGTWQATLAPEVAARLRSQADAW